MCDTYMVISKDGAEAICFDAGDLSEALGRPIRDLLSYAGAGSGDCLCSVRPEIGAVQATEAQGWPHVSYVIDLRE